MLAYPLLLMIRDMTVYFEEGPNVESLASPKMSLDGPVKGKLQRSTVEGAGGRIACQNTFGASRLEAHTHSTACREDMLC
jgi:hypothetical protein